MEFRVIFSLLSVSLLFTTSSVLSKAPMEGEVRLTGLNSSHKGRVELFYNGEWGTLCDNDYGKASRVICYQLNFTMSPASHHGNSVRNLKASSEEASLLSHSDDADKPIHFWDVDCGPVYSDPPSVIHLLRCEREELVESINCTHRDDLVVFCNSNVSDLEEPYLTQVRLIKNADHEMAGNDSIITFPSSGTLEIYLNYTWGNTCYTNFTQSDADTACRQLGYTGASSKYEEKSKTIDRVWLSDNHCNESRDCLNSCYEPTHVVKQSSCADSLYVGLECSFNMAASVNLTSGNPIKCNYTKRYSKVPAYFIGIMGGAFIQWAVTVTVIIVTAVCFTKETCPGYKYRNNVKTLITLE